MDLLCRYITQGRVEAGRPHLSTKRVARLLLTRPAALSSSQQALLGELTTACPEMTSLARLVGSLPHCSGQSPGTRRGSRTGLRTPGPVTCRPSMPSPRGLELDPQAVTAAVTLPFHNGRTEGVNTRTKMIKRQMYGRAGFTLLRHRIMLS